MPTPALLTPHPSLYAQPLCRLATWFAINVAVTSGTPSSEVQESLEASWVVKTLRQGNGNFHTSSAGKLGRTALCLYVYTIRNWCVSTCCCPGWSTLHRGQGHCQGRAYSPHQWQRLYGELLHCQVLSMTSAYSGCVPPFAVAVQNVTYVVCSTRSGLHGYLRDTQCL